MALKESGAIQPPKDEGLKTYRSLGRMFGLSTPLISQEEYSDPREGFRSGINLEKSAELEKYSKLMGPAFEEMIQRENTKLRVLDLFWRTGPFRKISAADEARNTALRAARSVVRKEKAKKEAEEAAMMGQEIERARAKGIAVPHSGTGLQGLRDAYQMAVRGRGR